MERADEKKPTEVGGCDVKPLVSDAMRQAGWDEVERLTDSCPANLLAEAVYIAMEMARAKELPSRSNAAEFLISREMVGAGLQWLDSDDPAGAVKDVFEAMMKVVCATPELRLAYLALLSESDQQGSPTRPV